MQPSYFELIGFGPDGWGKALLAAALMTVSVATSGFMFGSVVGAIVASFKLSRFVVLRIAADVYITVLRGVPDLLVIYLLYFGGSSTITAIAKYLGGSGFVSIPSFAAGVCALGIISGAFQGELFRGAFLALGKGELEAARSFGMDRWLMLSRIIVPQVIRYAIPGMGNIWQLALKESALISVIGLVEILRQSQMGAGATARPFDFYITAFFLYLTITWASGNALKWVERRSMRGVRRAV
jgi:octopine/nopaline transport system permease protein